MRISNVSKNSTIHKIALGSLLGLLLLPSLASSWIDDRKSESRIFQAPAIHTVRELAKDPDLKSRNGDDFKVYRYDRQNVKIASNKTDASYRFLVQGGLHGNEKLASAFVLWLAERFASGDSLLNKLQAQGAVFDFLPYANPDGTHAHSRYNAGGVNLNRNFGVLWGIARENPGQNSFSEPETKAIRYLFKERKYTAAIDVHGYVNWVVVPSEPAQVSIAGMPTSTERVREYTAWTQSVRREMQVLPGYQFKTAGGLGDGGAFEDWAFWSQGTLAMCLELANEQRFQTSYRRSFAGINVEEKDQRVDTFLKYEMFVYRMFEHAIRIKQTDSQPSQLAAQ